MKHLYPNLRKIIVCMLVSVTALGCVNSAYDLGNISLKIVLGPNGVTLPLGRVDSVTVDSLMKRSELDNLIFEEGFYAYKLDGMIDESIDAVKMDLISDVIPALAPHNFRFSRIALPEADGFEVFATAPQLSASVVLTQLSDNTFNISDEVAYITSAKVVDASTDSDAMLTIALDIRDTPISHCYFDDINIRLPHFVEVQHPGLTAGTNTIHIDRAEYNGRPVTIARIKIKTIRDIDVTGTAGNKIAHLIGNITIGMTINTAEDTPTSGLEDMELTLLPDINVSTLRLTEVSGDTDIDLQKYLTPTTIDLDDIRKSLGDSDVEINLVAPQIYLSVHNPVGVTLVGDITLQPYDFSNRKLEPIVVRNIMIEPAYDAGGQLTRLFITDDDRAPEGYTLCRVEDLAALVRTIPSKLEISFDLATDDMREQRIFLTGEDYPFTVDYTIKIPLRFQDNAGIAYTNISSVKDTFKELDDYEITIEDILITLDARSTLPMDLGVEIELLDADKQPLSSVTATVTGVIGGYDPQTDGEYMQSTVNIRLEIEDGDLGHLARTAWLRYTMQGAVQGSGAGLTPEQYIDARMKLHLKKGITIDLDK